MALLVPLPTALAALPRYFLWRDVLALFEGDEAAFTDAWVAGTLPPPVRQVCLEQMPNGLLHLLLLARMCRTLDHLLVVLEGDAAPPAAAPPAPRPQ